VIDYDTQIVSALNAVLPTHDEMQLTSSTKTPCISYMELNNSAITEVVGATKGYSRITYQIKVWATKKSLLKKYAAEIDNVMRPLGFKRISSGEMHDNNSTMRQKIITYEALALEDY
jgi:cupin superfamily acireductone dioxygenase involved in methionine salvage